MRFEIRAGGAFAILLGLGALSGAVFLLGLVAGYEMGRQQESNRQFASVYPLPSPPAAEPSPSPAAELGAVAAPTSTPALIASTAPQSPPQVNASAEGSTREASSPTPAAEASAAEVKLPSRSSLARLDSPASGHSAGARSEHRHEREPGSAPSSTRRKPYSIQIEAAMDRAGAQGMVAKLRRMGYSAYIVETRIAGQTWYRVRVGPYATTEEASEAEAALHQRYTGAFTTR